MLNYFRSLIIVSISITLIFLLSQTPQKLSKRAIFQKPFTILYYGQNKLGTVGVYEEPPISQICNTIHPTIALIYMRRHFDTNGLPELDFDGHDSSSLGTDIQNCNKKFVLSISPLDILQSDQEAIQSATNVWNLFLSSSPSSTLAVLDGIDLFIRTNDQYITKFVQVLLQYRKQRYFSLSATVGCSFPDARLGPVWSNLVFTTLADQFDWITLDGRGSPDCTYRNKEIMYQTIEKWFNWVPVNVPIYFLLVAQEGFMDDSPGDFINTTTLIKENITPRLFTLAGKYGKVFGGYGVFEASAEMYGQACLEDDLFVKEGKQPAYRTFGDVAFRQVELGLSGGNKTTGYDVCTYPSTSTSNGNTVGNLPPSKSRIPNSSKELKMDLLCVIMLLILNLLNE